MHFILAFGLILELQGASESQIESSMSESAQDKDKRTAVDHFGLIIWFIFKCIYLCVCVYARVRV